MASFFTIILDTIAPAITAIKINNGAAYVNDADRLCTVTITTGDSNTTGYQMKIWGDIDTSNNTSIQSTEGTSSWMSYEAEKQIKLSSGDGIKNVYCKLRDDVGNESSIVSAQTILDTEIHVVTVQSQSVTKISAVEGYNTVTFSFFVSDTNPAVDSFTEYKVLICLLLVHSNMMNRLAVQLRLPTLLQLPLVLVMAARLSKFTLNQQTVYGLTKRE